MDERINGCVHCSTGGEEQMDVPFARFAASVHSSLAPKPLNYTNGGLVSAVQQLMVTTLFKGTNDCARAIC